jgi:hypothetical protein
MKRIHDRPHHYHDNNCRAAGHDCTRSSVCLVFALSITIAILTAVSIAVSIAVTAVDIIVRIAAARSFVPAERRPTGDLLVPRDQRACIRHVRRCVPTA